MYYCYYYQVRSISLRRLSLLRFVDSHFLETPPMDLRVPPLNIKILRRRLRRVGVVLPQGPRVDRGVPRLGQDGTVGRIYTSLSLSLSIYIYIYIYIHIYTYIYTYMYSYTCIHVYIYIYIYMYTCICVCIYIYIYRERER